MGNAYQNVVNNMLLELKGVVDNLRKQQIEVETIHAYICHYEAESEDEQDEYYVNVKVCYSCGEHETLSDGFIFYVLEVCQSHMKYVESKLIEHGYSENLLVDTEPN